MAVLKTENGEFFYTITGSGEPIVILRGLGRSVKHWMNYDEYLGRDFRVICMDHRGVGRTETQMTYSTTMFDLAGDIAELLTHLKIDRAHIMGVSLGGMVALAFGMNHPEKTRSLTIINASIGGEGHLRMSFAGIGAIATRFLSKSLFHKNMAKVLTGHLTTSDEQNKFAHKWQEIEEEEGLSLKSVTAQIMAAMRFRVGEKLKAIKIPTLILVGTGDQFVPVDNSETIASLIPGSKLVRIEDAGHEMTLDAPQKVRDEIKAFVTGK